METYDLIGNGEKCCGCLTCVEVCPRKAVNEEADASGFAYPRIETSLCVDCKICKKNCAFQNEISASAPVKCYAAVSKNPSLLNQSASGGVFSTLAERVIEEAGVVYGAAFVSQGNNIKVEHVRVIERENLTRLLGSKYVQSRILGVLPEIRKDLSEGKKVLFSGTPCQVDAVKNYLNNENTDNLILIDIICHGVPNEMLFNDYILTLKKSAVDEFVDFKFRDKEKGWGMHGLAIFQGNGKDYKRKVNPKTSSYYRAFVKGYTYRDSCYNCKYAQSNRPGDITIGDYWGVEDEEKEYIQTNSIRVENGVSCVLVNSRKGQEFLNENETLFSINETELSKIVVHNEQLRNPSGLPDKREKLLDAYRQNGYYAFEKIMRAELRGKYVFLLLWDLLPYSVRSIIKRVKRLD